MQKLTPDHSVLMANLGLDIRIRNVIVHNARISSIEDQKYRSLLKQLSEHSLVKRRAVSIQDDLIILSPLILREGYSRLRTDYANLRKSSRGKWST